MNYSTNTGLMSFAVVALLIVAAMWAVEKISTKIVEENHINNCSTALEDLGTFREVKDMCDIIVKGKTKRGSV